MSEAPRLAADPAKVNAFLESAAARAQRIAAMSIETDEGFAQAEHEAQAFYKLLFKALAKGFTGHDLTRRLNTSHALTHSILQDRRERHKLRMQEYQDIITEALRIAERDRKR